MNFSTPERVLATIRAGDEVERNRSENRSKILDSANCVPILSKEEGEKAGIKIRTNWGTLMLDLARARRQYVTAFEGNQYYFRVRLPLAPAEHQSEWEQFITETINSIMKRSMRYYWVHDSVWTSVPSYGLGAMTWRNEDDWCQSYVACSDLRIATDTTLDFTNLGWWAERRFWRPGELLDAVMAPGSRWSKELCGKIIKNYKDVNWDDSRNHYNYETDVEKLHELVKQDGGYYFSDAMPAIPLWHFYFEDLTDEENQGWFRVIVPDNAAVRGGSENEDFLWKSDQSVSPTLDQLLHCQFGDLANDAPRKVNSIRSLGLVLVEPAFYGDLTRNRLLQHMFDNFNIWLRSNDPADKARAQVQEFGNFGVLKPGVSVVPQAERHQVSADLVEMGLGQMTELRQDAASTYTQDTKGVGSKERTAFEVNTDVQRVNALMGGLLLQAFKQATPGYRENCRRFCRPNTRNTDCKKFQQRCKDFGIPAEWLDVERWETEPVTPLGMGNPTMAQAAAKQLMELRPSYGPSAQDEILHEVTMVITQDARKAARWAPINRRKPTTDAQIVARSFFGTLMQGVALPPPDGLSAIEQVEAMIPLYAGKIAMIEKRNNMAEPDEGIGLQTVDQYIMSIIAQLAQNPAEKQRVKQYADQVGQLRNLAKALIQRGVEAQQKAAKQAQQGNGNGGMDPKLMMQAAHEQRMAGIREKAEMRKHQMNQKMKSDEFVRDQRRKDAGTFADIQREKAKADAQPKAKFFEE